MILVAFTFGVLEKVSYKGMDLGSLKRALIVLKFSCSNYHKYVNICYEYGLGDNLVCEILPWFQNLKVHYDFYFVERCDINL